MSRTPLFPKDGPCLTIEEVADYLARRPADPERVERHLAGCPECLDLALGAHALAGGEADAPARAVERALSLRPARRLPSARRLRPRRRPNPFLSLAAAAAVVLVAVLAAVALTQRTPAPVPPAPPVVRQTRDPERTEAKEPVRRDEPRREERTDEKVVEKKVDPKREAKPERGIADRVPGPRSETKVRAEVLAVRSVTGRVRYRDRELRAGDALELVDALRTPFGECARIETAGTTIHVHHDTGFSLGPGPVVRLDQGRLFIRSASGLRAETSAGSVTPLGTEFGLEVSGNVTTVVVRSGLVRFANARGEQKVEKGQLLRCAPGQTPGRPARADLAAALAWVEGMERAGGGPDAAWMILYPAPQRSGIVVTAPHMPIETQTSRIAAGLAERLQTSLVVAHGYKRPRKIDVNVPGDDPASREAYDEYRRLIRDGASASPVPFLVEIHGYGDEEDPAVIEIATAGFAVADAEAVKRTYARLLRKHAPEVQATLVFDVTDPTYEAGGKRIKFKYPALDLRTRGVFRKEVAARGWKVSLPHACRWRCRDAYVAILAELVESLR